MARQSQMTEAFRSLHQSGGFIMPNVWDVGSAIILAQEGFPAIATTSAGIAFSLGKPDYDARYPHLAVTRTEMFDRIRQIVECASVPVNGDLEAGYGDAPETVAETIRMAIEAGLAGGNIEDKYPGAHRLYDEDLAVERIRAARIAIDKTGAPFVLTARTDAFLVAPGDALRVSVRRCNLFREAGADCLYPPGAADMLTIKTLVREIDGPLNIVTGLGNARFGASALIDEGVRRVSLGGSIARAALGFVRACGKELRGKGTIEFASGQIGQMELNALFAEARRS